MIVVADTSVISNLRQIEQLELLQKIYQVVFIPEMVFRELKKSSHFIKSSLPDWLLVKGITDINMFNDLSKFLDDGESEAIVLSLEIKADILVIDDHFGREKALELGITTTGLLGVLLQAKKENHITEVKPMLLQLQAIGFRMSSALQQRVLILAKEI